VVAQRRADIVHLHTFGSQVVGTRAALRCGVRIVRTEHSSRVYDDPTCWPFSRWSLQRADAAVCISAHVRDVALTRAPWAAPKLRVVANGVDVERFAPTSMPRGAPVRFIAVGRLEPRKGFDIALAALAQVSNAELDIVGDGQDRAALERLAARLGVARRVRFLGYQEDVRGALADAHLAVSSARAEGLGIALLEAMATRRAVVALPTGGIPEIVRDGETGWLARGNDAPALARVMREAMGQPDEIQRRSERARALVVEHYSVASMREGYDAVYQSA
jgi:glycosyltransferase involved in cell wall biosynthesis